MELIQETKEKPVKVSTAFDSHIEKYEKVFIAAYQHIKQSVKDSFDDAEVVIDITVQAMQLVADADLHGWEKKTLVSDLVQKLVKETVENHDDLREKINSSVIPVVHTFIDMLISAAKGYLYLKHKTEEVVNNHHCCIPIRRRRQRRTRTVELMPIEDTALDLTGMVDDVYDVVKSIIVYKEITLANLMPIGSVIMQVVEQYPQLVGYQKKHIVLQVAHRLVDKLGIDEGAKTAIKVAIDTTLDRAIDFIIRASRGEVELLNKLSDAIGGCIDRCAARPKPKCCT